MDGPLPVMKRWASVLLPSNKMYEKMMHFSFRWACSWILSNCFHLAMTSSLPDLKRLTPAQAANAIALQNAMPWFSAAGAGPALLAACLRGRGRVRRALAGVGLVFTVANHCVFTCLLGATVVNARDDDFLLMSVLSAGIFILLVVGDVNAALTILRRRRRRSGWEDEY